MPPGTVPWILTLLLLLSCLPGRAQAKYANGVRRTGKKLVGPPVLEEHHVSGPLRCLFHCDVLDTCSSLNFNTETTGVNCHLFGEKACPNHQLVADAAVNYYDVYDLPVIESQLSFWDDPICAEDGYCSTNCSTEHVGDACIGDAHCSSQNMAPPSAYVCQDRTCQLAADFWELRPGLALPRWMNWVLNPWMQSYKKLKDSTCALDIKLKLGIGATVELKLVASQRETETRLKFIIGLETTTLQHVSEQPHEYEDIYYYDYEGNKTTIVSQDTTGMVNTDTFTLLKISWCEGAMSIGPVGNQNLVSGLATDVGEVGEIVYLAGTSSGPESYLRVKSDVADSWLFEEDGTSADPVFSLGDTMVERKIEPGVDVTVKYDCKGTKYCNVFFRSSYPHMLTVYVGGWENTECGLAYNDSTWGPWLLKTDTGPVLHATEFNTFTVRYNNGAVTVFRNDAAEPIFNVTAPTLLPPITRIGIGSMFWGGWKSVRVARYDPAWRTDTWTTAGSGFSNMDSSLYSP